MGDFLYQKEIAPCGITIEEIFGAEEKSAKVWKLFAMQIFSEAEGDYRSIGHFENGAPYLDGVPQRISISHTSHFLVVVSLPETSDFNPEDVEMRTAIGVDIEKSDRAQVLKIKDKFLSQDELNLLPPSDNPDKASSETIKKYILAWTCKEALYKSVLGKASDWKNDYRILALPEIAHCLADATSDKYGKAEIILNGCRLEMLLSAWEEEGHVLTLAFSPEIASVVKTA